MSDLNLDLEELYFIPLGGSEEFGINLNVYAHQNQLLVVDMGIGFADQRFPGIDILLPDPAFIESRKKNIAGLIITHAHEDHIGAVPYLWPRLKCPVYCNEFTAAVLRNKFAERDDCKDAEIHIVPQNSHIQCGPFHTTFLPMVHSIPQTSSLLIETKAGRVFHSADWNLDERPMIGKAMNPEPLQKASEKGVLAYIGDSTNAENKGRAGSESDVGPGLEKLFKDCKGRIAVTIFSSNIGRIKSIAKAAQACGRHTAIIGRSLHRMIGVARECGYLNDIPEFVSEEEAGYLPNDKIVMICTGSQGEPRAMLSRIARGDHKEISLSKGDTVFFSSRAIPGNEKEIIALKNTLIASGVKVITPRDTDETIHVSGHAYADEIKDMYAWVKPNVVVPVHGERSMLEAQSQLAQECGIKNTILPNNGSVIHLKKDASEVIGHVETGILVVEPGRIVKSDHAGINQRKKLQYSGTVHVSLVMNARGDLVADAQISSMGLVDLESEEGHKFIEDIAQEIEDILADLTREELYDDQFVAEEIRIGIRRFVYHTIRIKPQTTVHLVRV